MSETMPPCFRNPDFLADYCCKGDMMPLLVLSSNQKKVGLLALTGLKLKAHNHLSRCAREMARSFTVLSQPGGMGFASRRGSDLVLK
jgi:hypothetical protein